MYKMRSLVTVMGAVFCAGALLLIPATAQAQECFPAPEGLVGWWPGDGNANDIQGSRNGSLTNGATFDTGKVNQAFSLNGLNDYVVVPNSGGAFDFGTSASFSWDAWFRTTGSTNLQTIVAKEDGTRPTFNSLLLPDGKVACSLQPNGSGTFNRISTGSYDDGTFHHVACIANRADNTLTMIVDGGAEVHQTTFPAGSTFVESSTDLLIGARIPAAPDRFFNGEIDEVEIYNRALLAGEIQAIFDAGSAGKCKDEDGDGFRPPEDCDDTDPAINPDAQEINFNFVDENCDGNLGDCDPCITWSNHGQYVRCISDAVSDCSTNSFTSEEADDFVSSAVRSDIGKTGFVPPECQ